MDSDGAPSLVLCLRRVQLAPRRDAAIALQHTKVGADERRLKHAVVARAGVEQGLKFRPLRQARRDLFFLGTGGQVVREGRAVQPWILRVEFEPVEFDFDQPHPQAPARQRQGRHQVCAVTWGSSDSLSKRRGGRCEQAIEICAARERAAPCSNQIPSEAREGETEFEAFDAAFRTASGIGSRAAARAWQARLFGLEFAVASAASGARRPP
jgi:hypothetical protein